jgi:DNA-binding transcriptional ArsR family regulator
MKTTRDALSEVFAAMADPTRRAILTRLAIGEATVSTLAEPFGISLPAVTKHIKVLEHAGLITKSKDAQWRHCKLNGLRFRDATNWLETYRAFWEESFDRLEIYLKQTTNEPPESNPEATRRTKRRTKRHGRT